MIGFRLEVQRAALVITDPQVDFLSPQGTAWPLVAESVERNHTVENIERLLKAAKRAHMAVAVSPHYYYPSDHRWGFGGPLEALMERVGVPPLVDDSAHHRADILPLFRPYFLDGRTLMASPHRACGPDRDDLATQLRRSGVDQIILAGMLANLCLESHLRVLLERGFAVAVVQDATAAAALENGDGYQAALVNFHYIADAVWTTAEAVRQM
jgi:nicotinamidase-related amidase